MSGVGGLVNQFKATVARIYVNMRLNALLMVINTELTVPEEAAAFHLTQRDQESLVATLLWWRKDTK